MKFKVDENLPTEIAQLLTDQGYNAMTVPEQQFGGGPDSEIASLCQREEWISVTLDTDFANIRAYPPETSLPGLWYCVLSNRISHMFWMSLVVFCD